MLKFFIRIWNKLFIKEKPNHILSFDPESLVNEIVGFSVMTIVGEINMTPVKDLLRML